MFLCQNCSGIYISRQQNYFKKKLHILAQKLVDGLQHTKVIAEPILHACSYQSFCSMLERSFYCVVSPQKPSEASSCLKDDSGGFRLAFSFSSPTLYWARWLHASPILAQHLPLARDTFQLSFGQIQHNFKFHLPDLPKPITTPSNLPAATAGITLLVLNRAGHI